MRNATAGPRQLYRADEHDYPRTITSALSGGHSASTDRMRPKGMAGVRGAYKYPHDWTSPCHRLRQDLAPHGPPAAGLFLPGGKNALGLPAAWMPVAPIIEELDASGCGRRVRTQADLPQCPCSENYGQAPAMPATPTVPKM